MRNFLIAAYAIVLVFVEFFAILARVDSNGEDPELARETAQAIILAPLWPVVVAVFAARWLPRAVGRLFYDAFGPQQEAHDV